VPPDTERPDDGLRVSDAERESTVAQLRQAFAEGRLDLDELGARTDRAYAATTRGHLRGVLEDLPVAVGPSPAPPVPAAHHPARRQELVGLALPGLIAVGIWLASGHQGGFWPIWVILATGIAALARYARGGRGRPHGPPGTRWPPVGPPPGGPHPRGPTDQTELPPGDR